MTSLTTRDLIDDDHIATSILKRGYRVDDALSFIRNAPQCLIERVANNVGMIDHVTIWDTQDPEEGFCLTLDNTVEIISEFRDHCEFVESEEADF